jgi:hypothetical protein
LSLIKYLGIGAFIAFFIIAFSMISNAQIPNPTTNFIDGAILNQSEVDLLDTATIDSTALKCQMENEGKTVFAGNANDLNYFVKYSCLRIYKFSNDYTVLRQIQFASFNVKAFTFCLATRGIFCYIDYKNILLNQVNENIELTKNTISAYQTGSTASSADSYFSLIDFFV